jgi:hypothetical protein
MPRILKKYCELKDFYYLVAFFGGEKEKWIIKLWIINALNFKLMIESLIIVWDRLDYSLAFLSIRRLTF